MSGFVWPQAFWLTLFWLLIQSTVMPDRTTGTVPRYQCLLLIRVSTTKQSQESDSPEHQLRRGLATAHTRFGVDADRVFVLNETWSGRKDDRPSLDQAFELAKTYAIPTLLVYDIDRLTRAGPAQYEIIKQRFKSIGCSIVDVKGVIQPDSNTLEGTGGDLGQDFAYDWSVFAASEKAEVMEAQMAKDEARKILSRTIPVQIRNAQLGRTNRPAQYGYRNIEIVDDTGKPQASKAINEEEAWYVRKLYDLMAAGEDIRRVCNALNVAGFRTRTYKRWNADRTKIVGTIGGNSMTRAWPARWLPARSMPGSFWKNGPTGNLCPPIMTASSPGSAGIRSMPGHGPCVPQRTARPGGSASTSRKSGSGAVINAPAKTFRLRR